jgi:thiazole synthase ThiGH ThiG subunit
MERRRIMMRHAVLVQDAQLVAVALAEERIELSVAGRKLASIRKRHDRLFPSVSGAKVEEAVESAETPGRLPASELSVAVGDRVEPIADDAALLDLHLLKLLA